MVCHGCTLLGQETCGRGAHRIFCEKLELQGKAVALLAMCPHTKVPCYIVRGLRMHVDWVSGLSVPSTRPSSRCETARTLTCGNFRWSMAGAAHCTFTQSLS